MSARQNFIPKAGIREEVLNDLLGEVFGEKATYRPACIKNSEGWLLQNAKEVTVERLRRLSEATAIVELAMRERAAAAAAKKAIAKEAAAKEAAAEAAAKKAAAKEAAAAAQDAAKDAAMQLATTEFSATKVVQKNVARAAYDAYIRSTPTASRHLLQSVVTPPPSFSAARHYQDVPAPPRVHSPSPVRPARIPVSTDMHGALLERRSSRLERDNLPLESDNSLPERDNSLPERDNSLLDRHRPLLERDISLPKRRSSRLGRDNSPLERDNSLLDRHRPLLERHNSLLESQTLQPQDGQKIIYMPWEVTKKPGGRTTETPLADIGSPSRRHRYTEDDSLIPRRHRSRINRYRDDSPFGDSDNTKDEFDDDDSTDSLIGHVSVTFGARSLKMPVRSKPPR